MDNKQVVIDALNKARSMELTGIHQYMIYHYMLDDLNYGKMATIMRKISIDEMKHAEKIAERIKELDGEPVSKLYEPIKHGQDLKEVFPTSMYLEDDTIQAYNEIIDICVKAGDHISKQLIQQILQEEQEHLNYFDDTNTHITELGAVFLANMTGKSED